MSRFKTPPKANRKKKAAKLPVCKILIVCEGSKTEPNYFESFAFRNQQIVFDIDIRGEGINTMSLVEYAIKLKDNNTFDEVWAVFDKDSFSPDQFNGAINKAIANDIQLAWSNEAFELWYILHLKYHSGASINREEYKKIISQELSKKIGKTFTYTKNNREMRSLITTYGSQELAIKNAKKLASEFQDTAYHTHNPCTLVYRLIEQLESLRRFDTNNPLIRKILKQME